MTGYLTAAQIESAVAYLAGTRPTYCTMITLPEPSVEGRAIRALRIRAGTGTRRAVLLLGGVHARELINPDLLVYFAVTLAQAYGSGTGMTFGGVTYAPATVRLLVEALELIIVPLVNPDGREFVQAAPANRMWRKNRSLNAGQSQRGVDLNRNYDFLFDSGIGTSTQASSDTYRGPAAFSEPESRNIRWLLDTVPTISGLLDVHSYSEDILYPWGDDDDQSADPGQNFTVPSAVRGVPGDTAYREYIPSADLSWYVQTGDRMRAAIAAVRGRSYTVMQSVGLYPTSATVDDYSYSRHRVDPTKRSVLSLTIETSAKPVGSDFLGAFQPPYAQAQQVMVEVCPALVEFCLSVLCVAESVLTRGTALRRLREVHAAALAGSPAAVRLDGRLQQSAPDVLTAIWQDHDLRRDVRRLLEEAAAGSRGGRDADVVLAPELVDRALELAQRLAAAVPGVQGVLDEVSPLLADSPTLGRLFERLDGR